MQDITGGGRSGRPGRGRKCRWNFRRGLRQVERRREPRNGWLSGLDASGGRRRQEKRAGGPGAQLGDFSRAIAGTGADRGLARAPDWHFSAIFRISERLSDFPASFRSVSGGVRCLAMGHKCLIVRHDKRLRSMAFWAWGVKEAILGFVYGTFMSHRVLRTGSGGSGSYTVPTINSSSARFAATIPMQGATARPADQQRPGTRQTILARPLSGRSAGGEHAAVSAPRSRRRPFRAPERRPMPEPPAAGR